MKYLDSKGLNQSWCAVKTKDALGIGVLDEAGEAIREVTFRADNIGFCCNYGQRYGTATQQG